MARTVVLESMSDTPAQLDSALKYTGPGSPFPQDDPAVEVTPGTERELPPEALVAAVDEDPEPEPEVVEVPKTPKGAAQMAGRLTREREEAKRETDATRAEIAALRKTLESITIEPAAEVVVAPVVKAPVVVTKSKPALADYDGDWELYTEALTDWKVEAAKVDIEAKADERIAKQREAEQQSAAQAAHTQAVAAYTSGIDVLIGTTETPGIAPDWKEVVSGSDLPWNDTLAAATLEISRLNTPELGPRIVYELAKRPELVKKLADQTAKGVSRDGFTFLCERLLALVDGTPSKPAASSARPGNGTTVPAKTAVVNRLPPPPRTVGGSPTAVTPDLARLAETDPAAFRQLRNEQDNRGRKRH